MDIHAGKQLKTDIIDHSAGFRLYCKIGDLIEKDQIIGKLHVNAEDINIEQIETLILNCLHFEESKDDVVIEKLIWKIIWLIRLKYILIIKILPNINVYF